MLITFNNLEISCFNSKTPNTNCKKYISYFKTVFTGFLKIFGVQKDITFGTALNSPTRTNSYIYIYIYN